MITLVHSLLLSHASALAIGAPPEYTVKGLEKARRFLEMAIQNGYDPSEAQRCGDGLYSDLADCYHALDRDEEAAACYMKLNTINAIIKLGELSAGQGVGMSSFERVNIYNNLAEILLSSETNQSQKAWGYYLIGVMLQDGVGIPQNTDEAYNSFLKSRDFGSEHAIKMLGRYKKKLFGGYEFR